MKVNVTVSKEVRKYVNKSKSVLEHIKKAEMEIKQYWINMGLNEDEIEFLIQMEIDEDMRVCDDKFYLSRKSKLELGMIDIDQIKNDISRYKRINKFRFDYVC